jgi:hypothetical protein
MRTLSRASLSTVLALALVTLANAGAGAATLTASPGGLILASSLTRIEVAGVSCNVGLRGTIRSEAISKVNGETVGRITEAIIPCEGTASARPLNLPWEIKFNSILGSLPSNITGVLMIIQNVQIVSEGLFLACLYQGDVPVLLGLTGNNPYNTGLLTPLTNSLPRVSGGFLCPSTISLTGEYRFTPQVITRN